MLLPLDSLTDFHRPLVGDKAMKLAQLMQQGQQIPAGFVLDGSVYRYVVMENNKNELLSVADSQIPGNASGIERFAANMARDIINLEFPEETVDEIREAWESLGSPALIIRPSGLGNTIPSSNTTGRPRGISNQQDADSILLAVKLAWVSLWSADAILYRQRLGLPSNDLGIAVILQRFIRGTISGIIYTSNPRNNRRDQIVIRSVWGLGESLVRDEVRPDHWVFDESGAIYQANITLKDTARQPAEDGAPGTELVETPEHQHGTATLESQEISELLSLATWLRRQSPNEPQLVEWTYEKRELQLLQVRPIVGMYPNIEAAPGVGKPPAGVRIYLQLNALIGSYAPLTPLGTDLWRLLLAKSFGSVTGRAINADPLWIKTTGGRLWLDITNQLTRSKDRRFLLTELAFRLPGAEQTILRALKEYENSFRRVGPTLGDPNLRLLMRTGMLGFFNPTKAAFRLRKRGIDLLSHLNEKSAEIADTGGALLWLENSLNMMSQTLLNQISYCLPGIIAWRWLDERISRWSINTANLHVLQQELFNSPSQEITRLLFYMANYIFERKLEYDSHHEEMSKLFRNLGHYANMDLDPGSPRWVEQQHLLESFIEPFMAMRENPEHSTAAMREHADRIMELLPRLIEQRVNIVARWEAEQAMRISRSLAGSRQHIADQLAQMMHLIRQVFLNLGVQLTAQHHLSSPEDIFFLTLDDLRGSIGSLSREAQLNRQSYERECLRNPVPLLLLSNGEAFYSEVTDLPSDQLSGLAVTPGEYTGYVRVVDDSNLAYIEEGEILVLREAQPDWSDKLIQAGALVIESADRSSYTGTIARVFGVPAVFAVPNATLRLSTGMHARVNGNRGLITILARPQILATQFEDDNEEAQIKSAK